MDGTSSIHTSSQNLRLVQSTIYTSVGSSSILVKAVSVTLIVFYFLAFSERLFDFFSAVPGYVLPPNFWIWTLVTHSFLQRHFILVLVDICVVVLSGKLLEPIWGPLQICIFFLIVTSLSAAITAVTYVFLYYITGNTIYLFETHIHGLGAYIGGFVVAVKQLMPDHVLLTLPFGKFRNKHMALTLLITAAIFSLINVINGPYALHFGLGIFVSWIYLRFYQRHKNGKRGDMADDFSFASFFPAPLETFIAILSNTVFSFLVRLKICKKPQRTYDVSSPTTITVTLPGTDPVDADRRRQLAIKALNERLNKSGDMTSWPGLEDDEEGMEDIELHTVKSENPAGEHKSTTTSAQQTGERSPPRSQSKSPPAKTDTTGKAPDSSS